MDIPDIYSRIEAAKHSRQADAHEAQMVLPSLLSGEGAFLALKAAVDELTRSAPADHDVLVEAFNLAVLKVGYIEPHSFLFRGLNQDGQDAFVICHFSQLVARVVYRPKKGASRVITGFANEPS